MTGFMLLLPFFIIRFGLLTLLNKYAVSRAAYFAPLLDNEKPAHWIYQISNAAILIYMLFLRIEFYPTWILVVGAIVYGAGLLFLTVSVINFAHPSKDGINQNGVYKFSRNPMYVAYFVFFIGCVMLTQSLLLLVFVLAFQISAHWIIKSEERWCIKKFGDKYLNYMSRVRRYF